MKSVELVGGPFCGKRVEVPSLADAVYTWTAKGTKLVCHVYIPDVPDSDLEVRTTSDGILRYIYAIERDEE